MSLPMNGLTIPLSEGVLLEEKKQHLLYEKKINPTSIIGRTHGNEFSKMALVPIIFECKRYETLSLYYVCYTDCVFSLDTPLKNFHIGVYIYLTCILSFWCVIYWFMYGFTYVQIQIYMHQHISAIKIAYKNRLHFKIGRIYLLYEVLWKFRQTDTKTYISYCRDKMNIFN